jgi:hypothetical protein
MPRLPWLKFWPNDWLADPAVRSCSPAARGLWIDCLALMHVSPRRGVLLTATGGPMPPETLGRLTGCESGEVRVLLRELEAAGVFDRDPSGAVVSRRMVRDEKTRAVCSRSGRKGGGSPLLKRGLNRVPAEGFKQEARGKRQEARKEEDASASSCPEPAKPPASGPPAPVDPPVLTFPVVGTGGREWHLSAAKLAEYRRAFPGVDVPAELLKARQWCLDNPAKRKTARGMPAFLGRWLGRAQDDAGRRGGGPRGKGESADSYALGMILDPDGGSSDDARGPQF